ncbi:hypothetical protein GCM10022419_123050 [Nonomuraea rosea]|uniref:Uncharacterized protein n=1 Tax=Nonomuraea rosea TaxID=638574 RepID=A0ABP6ZQM6_9ACTN
MTQKTIRFAVSLPQQVAEGTFDPGAFRAYARRAEEPAQLELIATQVLPELR